MQFFDTIAAISTPVGSGGVAIIRISGETAVDIISPLVFSYNKKTLSDFESHKLTLCKIKTQDSTKVLDEALVVVMRAPHSFTGENVVEIQCHGGYIVAKRILEEIIKAGARLAGPGEFTRRSFINGKTDLLKAEASSDLISSTSYLGAENAAKTLTGELSLKINSLRKSALALAANISAAADYPDEVDAMEPEIIEKTVGEIEKEINLLLSGFEKGKMLREGIQTVIAGRPNVGKSSILNAMLREDKSIVTDIPGTTRDIVEDYVNLKGLTLKIMDTAGIRKEADVVEQIGIERAYDNLKSADLCLFIVDSSKELTSEDMEIFNFIKDKKYIIVLNKSDMSSEITKDKAIEFFGADSEKIVSTFVPKNSDRNISELEDKIFEMFLTEEISSTEVYITGERQKNALLRAKDAVLDIKNGCLDQSMQDFLYIDLENLIFALGEITGETVQDEIIDEVFANFCVGK